MTIEEKLQHFYDLSVEEAKDRTDSELAAHQARLDEMFAEHKKAREAEAQSQLKAETENARREVNKALSAEQLSLKRGWTKKQNELRDKLFIEVKDRMEAFMDSREYENYLCRKIREVLKFAGDDEVFIYLCPEDSSHKLSIISKTGFPVQVAEEAFMGGIRAEIPSKNILIDNSFLSAFTSMRAEYQFQFDGGAKA